MLERQLICEAVQQAGRGNMSFISTQVTAAAEKHFLCGIRMLLLPRVQKSPSSGAHNFYLLACYISHGFHPCNAITSRSPWDPASLFYVILRLQVTKFQKRLEIVEGV